jgi:UDP-glucuronate 4-epimerase
MAPFAFTRAILNGESIDVYNGGDMKRDFTYIDDVVEAVVRVTDRIPKPETAWNSMEPDPSTSPAPYRIYNVGNNNPVGLLDFIRAIEEATGKTARKNMLPMQPGDVRITYADVDDLMDDVGFSPSTAIGEGTQRFADWYKSYSAR